MNRWGGSSDPDETAPTTSLWTITAQNTFLGLSTPTPQKIDNTALRLTKFIKICVQKQISPLHQNVKRFPPMLSIET